MNDQWDSVLFVALVLGVLTFVKFVLRFTLHEFITKIIGEKGSVAGNIKSPESLNALTLILMFILIMLFFGSYVARELNEIAQLFHRGAGNEHQGTMTALFAIGLLGGAGLLSVAAIRRL
jgi:hypothetical protein